MEKNYPFILEVIEEAGEICLTDEEHRVLLGYFRLVLRKDNIERRQIYFRGHTDGYAYLKKIGAENGSMILIITYYNSKRDNEWKA